MKYLLVAAQPAEPSGKTLGSRLWQKMTENSILGSFDLHPEISLDNKDGHLSPLTLHTADAREIWIDQSGFSRREKF